MTLSLHYFPSRLLTAPCEPVPATWFDGEPSTVFLTHIVAIANLCHQHRGYALAANQAGLPYRFIVLLPHRHFQDQAEIAPTIIVNPIINSSAPAQVTLKEGCLSFPDLLLPVSRSEAINLTWQDNRGTSFTRDMTGVLARVVQHEIDHLDGQQFIDRMNEYDKGRFSSRINKLRRR